MFVKMMRHSDRSDLDTAAETRVPTDTPGTAASRATTAVFTTIGLALMVAASSTIYYRAGSTANAAVNPAEPIVVDTVVAKRSDKLVVTEHYVGRIEAARDSALAFEHGGTLAGVAVEEGDVVRKGDVIAWLDDSSLAARHQELMARKAALDAQIELAGLVLERTTKLSERGHASTQNLDTARLEEERLVASRQQIEASLASLAIEQRKSKLVAPFDGQISVLAASEGEIMAAGEPVVTVMETGRPQLRVGLPVDRQDALRDGSRLEVEYAGRTVTAQAVAVRPDIDLQTRTVTALLDLPNTLDWRFGDMATLRLKRERSEAGFWLPIQALSEGPRGLWTVFTVPTGAGQPQIAMATVEVIVADGEEVFVRGTLRPGQHIVANGRHRITTGTDVMLASAL